MPTQRKKPYRKRKQFKMKVKSAGKFWLTGKPSGPREDPVKNIDLAAMVAGLFHLGNR